MALESVTFDEKEEKKNAFYFLGWLVGWVGESEDGGQQREDMGGVHHKLETASRTSVKMFVELPIDVAVVASAEVLFHVARILLLVDPIDNVLIAKY